MTLTDTHAHLDFPDFEPDLGTVLGRARAAGVERIITVGIGRDSIRRALALAENHPGLFATAGVHPTEPEPLREGGLAELEAALRHPRLVALGEMGLDYHHVPEGNPPGWKERQRELFMRQLALARAAGKPAVIHSREAGEDTLAALAAAGRWRECPGVLHCFSGSPEMAGRAYELGYAISVGGVLTFKNAAILREVVRRAPHDRLMLETDCPFLAPAPHRGKRCEPAHVRLVAEKVAELWGWPLERTCRQIEENVSRIFGIPHPVEPGQSS